MVRILKPIGSGACWISTLNGKVDVDCAASVFLFTNFLSLALSLFISLFMGETIRRSYLLLEVTEVHLTSRRVRISSPLLRPSRSKTLQDSLRASSVISLSHDLTIASSLVMQPDAVIFWSREGPTSSPLLLTVGVERVDSACKRETCCEFTRRVEVTLPRVVALATCCSTQPFNSRSKP